MSQLQEGEKVIVEAKVVDIDDGGFFLKIEGGHGKVFFINQEMFEAKALVKSCNNEK